MSRQNCGRFPIGNATEVFDISLPRERRYGTVTDESRAPCHCIYHLRDVSDRCKNSLNDDLFHLQLKAEVCLIAESRLRLRRRLSILVQTGRTHKGGQSYLTLPSYALIRISLPERLLEKARNGHDSVSVDSKILAGGYRDLSCGFACPQNLMSQFLSGI